MPETVHLGCRAAQELKVCKTNRIGACVVRTRFVQRRLQVGVADASFAPRLEHSSSSANRGIGSSGSSFPAEDPSEELNGLGSAVFVGDGEQIFLA